MRKEIRKLQGGLPVAEDVAINDKGASLQTLEAKIADAHARLKALLQEQTGPSIKPAVKAAASGAKEAYKALDELFGGGRLGAMGPTFDEKTYAKAKPHFQAAWEEFKKAGRALKDFLVHIFKRYGEPVLQYIKRFVQEKQAEELRPEPAKAPVERPKSTAFQEPYEPRSEGNPFGTLTPRNVAGGEHAALDALKARHGSIDNYVADRLNMTPAEVRDVMASEQIDGVALTIDQIERGGSVIVGDETGIGKGRQAAALIRYAIINGKIPVFFTKDPKLFTDMYGDLKDIHTDLLADPDIGPLIMGDPSKASIVDNKGNVLRRAPGSKALLREMGRIQDLGFKEAGYNAIFSTYSQINDRNARQLFLEQLARTNPTIIILDEAHEAAGDSESSMQAAFMSGGQVRRGSGATQRRITVPGLLNQAGTKAAQSGGVMYLSATYAKRPENMPVYFRTDLSKAARGFSEIVNAMKKGGVALQQAVSEALAKAGQYLRRERDFTGVRYDMKTVGADRAEDLIGQVDQVTDVLSQIMEFSESIRDAVQGGGGPTSTAMSQSAVDMTDFAAIVHNQVSQLLLAAKADDVVRECVEAVKRGEKPVVALMNTMESFLDQFVDDKKIQPGQAMQLRWNELLKHALSRTLRAKNKLPNGDTVITIIDPDEYGLGDEYRAIEEAAGEVETKFPVSPIDYIIQSLAKHGIKMYELTGRESGIDYTDPESGTGTYKRFQKANKNTVVNGFNNTKGTGMLLNASGSTGLSAHASEKFDDQDPRHMVIAQPAADINVFIQTLGRIKRTGMVLLGMGEDGQPYGARYTHLVLPLQAELRPAAMTARKMKSLNANTTAEADAAIKIDAEDLFNRYGDRIVCEYLDQHPEFQSMLNLPVDLKDDGSLEIKRDYARKFTGRMAVLPDATQRAAYEEILPAYRTLIDQLKATGEYDLEIVVHDDWDGQRQEDTQLEAGPDDSSIFTSGVRLQRWQVRDTRHVPTGAEMVREFNAKTGGREKLLQAWDQVREKGDNRIAELQARLDKEKAELAEMTKPDDQMTDTEKAARDFKAVAVARLELQVNGAQRRWEVAKDMADHIMPLAGRVIELSNADTGDLFDGMMVDVKFPTTRYTSSAFRFRFMLHAPGGVAYVSGAQFSPIGWQMDISDKDISELKGGNPSARYERYLVTGNPIRGYTVTGGRGKMVRFKSHDGELITGLLMPRNWGPGQLANDPRMDLVNGRAAAHFLSNYGMDGSKSVPIECASIVRITRQGWSGRTYTISTASSRTTGAAIFLDPALLRITGDFTKTGNRMVANIDEADLEKAVNRISDITKKAFRPIGKADTLIPQVDESNNRGKRRGSLGPSSPVPQPRGPVTAGSVEELRQALPNSGLEPQAIKLMTAFLDSKLGAMLEGVRYQIADTIANGYQGSYWQNLAEIARGASPETGVHELLHAVWDIMPDDLKAEFERLRQAHIDEYQKEAKEKGKGDLVGALEDIRQNPTEGGEYFMRRNYPFQFQRQLYSVSSPEEFFTHTASARFQKKVGSKVTGFWDRVKELLSSFVEAIRSAFRRKKSLNDLLDRVLNGNFKASPRATVDAERAASARQASIPTKGPPVPEDNGPKSDTGLSAGELETMDDELEQALADDTAMRTVVFGRRDTVRGRETIGPAERAQGAAHAAAIFAKAGLQVQPQDNGLWELVDPGFESEIEGRRLLQLLREEIGDENESGRASGFLGNLLNSVVENFTVDDVTAFSQPLKEELYAVAQGERSHRGVLLAALRGFGKTVAYVARHVDVVLKRTYSDHFGGDFVRKVLNRVATNFRDYFTEDEIGTALAGKPELANLIDKAMALNRRDEGNRAYRMTQSLLKPKKKKTLARLESDARALEAFRAMVEEAKRQGVEPPANPNKPLTPVQQLMRAANPKTAVKIEKIVQEAVAQGMRNAGIKAALSASKDADERSDLEGRFAAGEEPSDEMIEAGLDIPEYAHWRVIRDNWLGYNPVTLKLVQKLISSDFKGTRFEAPAGRPIDTRLDLANLAKSPEAEVQRVLDAFYDKISQTLDIADATAETRQRVLAAIEENVTTQLEQARQRVRDPLFKPPTSPTAQLTPEQRIGKLINAGLFRDPRLDVPTMVQRVASKSAIGRLTPKAGQLVRQALQTPFYRQDDIPEHFAQILSDQLGIAPEQVQHAKEVFAEAMRAKFAAARERAAKQAIDALTPQDRQFVRKGKALWIKLNEAINTGNFDSGDVLRQVADAHGWHYSQASVDRLKELSGQLQRLTDLSPAEQAGATPSDIPKLLREKARLTENKQIAIKREMQAIWARLTKPISLRHWWTNRANFAAAANEFEVANLLLKVGFPIRLATHITTQLCVHTPTRAIGDAFDRYVTDKDSGRETRLWSDLYSSLTTSYVATVKALVPALQSAKSALLGRTEVRNVDRLMGGIQALERASIKAEELKAQGKPVQAGIMRLMSWVRLSLRVTQALDNFQGTPAEAQELRALIVTSLRENGRSPAEAEVLADEVLRTANDAIPMAVADASRMWAEIGEERTPAELAEDARNLVKGRTYEAIRRLGLPVDDFEEKIRLLRSTIAWQERTTTGPGGVVATAGKAATAVAQHYGLPFSFARFANAFGTGINYSLMFTPAYSLANARLPGQPPSSWFGSRRDQYQRRAQAVLGSMFGAAVFALFATGAAIARLKWPQSKEEREMLQASGHRLGTVEIPISDHEFIPVSMTVGPLALFAPYVAAGSAVHDLAVRQAKQQEELDKKAEKTGLPAGKARSMDAADLLGVAGAAAANVVMGGKTATGLAASITEEGNFNSRKFAAAYLSPMVPALPAYQEISRMMGVSLDSKLASIWDFLVPLPGSQARAINVLGDPVGTPDAVQRVFQVFTAGTYPGVVDTQAIQSNPAYAALIQSGFRPPTIDPNKGYAINGEYRPFTDVETAKYAQIRGELLKQALSGLGTTADAKSAKQTFDQINQEALGRMGVDTGATALASAHTAPAGAASAPAVTAPAAPRLAATPAPRRSSGGTHSLRVGLRRPGGITRGVRGPKRSSLRRPAGLGGPRIASRSSGSRAGSGIRSLRPRR